MSKKLIFALLLLLPFYLFSQAYTTKGVGGGGALAGFSISPYSDLWFAGSDLGTLYRSADEGHSWYPVHHYEARFSNDLPNAAYIGFNPDTSIVFHAYGGCVPKRSTDAGLTWTDISSLIDLLPTTGYNYADCKIGSNANRIRYWVSDSFTEDIVFAGGGTALYRSADKGITWAVVPDISGTSKGTFIDYNTSPHSVYHATENGIYLSTDAGLTFSLFQESAIRGFAGGRDEDGLTLSFIDSDDSACSGTYSNRAGYTNLDCGYVWISHNGGAFARTDQVGGDWIRMAENNSQVLYVTGARVWNESYGTQVWVSPDAGQTFTKQFQQLITNRTPYAPWPAAKFDWSAVGLDIGWDDSGYRSFSVNRRNATIAGGTGNYFLHVTRNTGAHWESPFTKFEDELPRGEKKRWSSTGLDQTSAWHLEFHPTNKNVAYSGYSDIGGIVTEDAGDTWRVCQTGFNTTYDFAFDPTDDQEVWAASSSIHDFPYEWYGNYSFTHPGGIYHSNNRGLDWTKITPNEDFLASFLAVAYDNKNKILYGGAKGQGVARSLDEGQTWEWYNTGLPDHPNIITQIEIDPENQDVYILLTGDKPDFNNLEQTGIYRLQQGSDTWELLRGNVTLPGIDGVHYIGPIWKYPIHFSVDWRDANRQKIWLTDMQIPGMYKAAGIWLTRDGGENWTRQFETPFPKRITLDPCDTTTLFVSGLSGPLYSTDDGTTWERNELLPLQYNLTDLVIDPCDNSKVYYTSFGNGILHGPRPTPTTCQPVDTCTPESPLPPIAPDTLKYTTKGVGGGGALAGFSISPYSDLWFAGSDLGTLYRSADEGHSWYPVHHYEATFSNDLPNAAYIGFNPDTSIVFHAYGGCVPKRSTDGGLTWTDIYSLIDLLPTTGYNYADCKIGSNANRIRYWVSDSFTEDIVFAGGGTALYRSADKGITWAVVPDISGTSKGTFIDYSTTPHRVYHATENGIYLSTDAGLTFSLFQESAIRGFTGGRDEDGLTLSFIDSDDSACSGTYSNRAGYANLDCGYVWISHNGGAFARTAQIGGDWIRMAENNSKVLYVTGARIWNDAYGTQVWVSQDAGQTFTQQFQQLLTDRLPFETWPADKFDWSAIGLDIGWDDTGYRSFSVNRRDATIAGGTGNYFLHVTRDTGENWESPFTKFEDELPRGEKKRWSSTGLDQTSAWHLEFHPTNKNVAYCGYSDIGGIVTEDAGDTWRICQTTFNTTYDFAFDPTDDQKVWAATSSIHDFPYEWYGNYSSTHPGGIYHSNNRGVDWTKITPDEGFLVSFLAVAYDNKNKVLYGGAKGQGVARSLDEGQTWEWYNAGLPNHPNIITQIEVDPENQDIYILLAGDKPDFNNLEQTGIYRLPHGSTTWEFLRGNLTPLPGVDGIHYDGPIWKYPLHFAVDWRDANRQKIWLTDMQIPGMSKAAGIWLTRDGGENWIRQFETPFPKRITLDPCDSTTIFVSGLSGPLYSTDDGTTWNRNLSLPLQNNLTDLVIDPNDFSKVYYASFGNGILHGPRPTPTTCQTTDFCNMAHVETSHLYLNDATLQTKTYHAQDKVESNATIASNASVSFKAGQSILLLPGFATGEAVEFIARIENCVTDDEEKEAKASFEKKAPEQLQPIVIIKPADQPTKSNLILTIQPNPFTQQTMVRYTLTKPTPVHIQVYSLNGKLIKQWNHPLQDIGTQEQLIQVPPLPSGMYFLSIQTREGSIVEKIIISP